MRYRSGETVNWLIVVLAAAAIAGAAVVCYLTFTGSGDGSRPSPERAGPMRFKCDSCGKEFSLSPVKYHEQLKQAGDVPREKQGKVNCPLCGGQSCATYLDPRKSPGPDGAGGGRP